MLSGVVLMALLPLLQASILLPLVFPSLLHPGHYNTLSPYTPYSHLHHWTPYTPNLHFGPYARYSPDRTSLEGLEVPGGWPSASLSIPPRTIEDCVFIWYFCTDHVAPGWPGNKVKCDQVR